MNGHDNIDPDDNTLRDGVESELFEHPEINHYKAALNVMVVGGNVELRGQLQSENDIETVTRVARRIRNVRGIHSYLHLPGTPAPNKASVLEVDTQS